MISFDRITTSDDRFKQVLQLRYTLLDAPVGAPNISEPSDNDRHPSNTHFIAQDGSRVVSAVRVDLTTEAEFTIRRMVTDIEYQRRGIGRAIMQLVEATIQQHNGRRILLNATPDAVEFYHELGYKNTDNGVEWAGVYHPEMRKDIETLVV